MQLDTQANVIQAMESGRADTAVVDLSTVRWLVARNGEFGFFTILQPHQNAPGKPAVNFGDPIGVDNGGAMDAHKVLIFEPLFQVANRKINGK